MAGTSSNRGEEFARVSRSESNNYSSGSSDSSSPMKEGFGPKMRKARDPNNNSNGTSAPSTGSATNKGTKARS